MNNSTTNIIYGKNPVLEILEAKQPVNKIFYSIKFKKPTEKKIISFARSQNIPFREVDRKKLTELVGHENHQGIVAFLNEVAYSEIDDIFEMAAKKKENVLIAILDEIQDPHNLGAIIRSAEALGFHGVIIPKDRSVGLTQTVAKTSAGAIAHIPIVRVNNLARLLDELKDKGVWITGTDHEANQSFYQADLNRALGVVIGNEGKGMRRLVKKKCDFLIKIPMFGKADSLNVASAATILLYETIRQRKFT